MGPSRRSRASSLSMCGSSPEVAATLDQQKRYGIWRFNTHRHRRVEVAVEGRDGRVAYKSRNLRTARPEGEWITVPIPDAGVPRE